jgi:hypothetical protein
MRTFIDQYMSAGAAAALVLAHIAALAWALALRKGATPALVLTLVVSAAILAYNADHLAMMLQHGDTAPLALSVYAAVALACAAGALCGGRIPAWTNWTAFAFNLTLSILLLTFLALFKMNRLF